MTATVISIIGAAVSVATVLVGWLTLRRELYKAAQTELIKQRMGLYPTLWTVTGDLERADHAERNAVIERFRDWYWADGGGLYLTNQSRLAFLAADDALNSPQDALWRLRLSELRNRLKEDIRGYRRTDTPRAQLDDGGLAAGRRVPGSG